MTQRVAIITRLAPRERAQLNALAMLEHRSVNGIVLELVRGHISERQQQIQQLGNAPGESEHLTKETAP
jgi:hypothetical protein